MNNAQLKMMNDFSPFLVDFKMTWQFIKLLKLPHRTICLFTGNQSMKTSGVCYQYVWRVLGTHPVPKKNITYFECSTRNNDNKSPHGFYRFLDNGVIVNGWEKGTWNIKTLPKDGKCSYCGAPIVIYQRQSKRIRLCAETLPGDKVKTSDDGTGTAETKNTIYPELLKWMPKSLIKRDITFRNPAMIVIDPLKGIELNGTKNEGEDILFDFMSYVQSTQAAAGVQLMSCYCDEEPPFDFWIEQNRRLFIEDGDMLLGLTPARQLSWTYDELFEKAQVYYRTQTVVDYMNKTEKDKNYKVVMKTDSPKDIAVLQAATDDNPMVSLQVLESIHATTDDPDLLATTRYGIHKQISGRIFKDFDYTVHYVDFEKYFPDGIFREWNHYRMIDYHPHNKWACIWLAISPENEAFIWREWSPDPEKVITRMIANEMAIMSQDYKFKINLIDPRAAETQTNTGTTTVEDLNDDFVALKREGICTGGYWETWDTKGTRGREVVRERLKNAKDCKRPFNNKIQYQGLSRHIPTLWISTRCPETARSVKQWRLESYARATNNVDKDRKETPTQKWSHFCTAIEAIFKDNRVRPPLIGYRNTSKPAPKYFNGRRARA